MAHRAPRAGRAHQDTGLRLRFPAILFLVAAILVVISGGLVAAALLVGS